MKHDLHCRFRQAKTGAWELETVGYTRRTRLEITMRMFLR